MFPAFVNMANKSRLSLRRFELLSFYRVLLIIILKLLRQIFYQVPLTLEYFPKPTHFTLSPNSNRNKPFLPLGILEVIHTS